jgi:hypothetical protein
LKDAGIESETVQRFIMRGGWIDGADERPVIFFVDESSLVSARQLHTITQTIRHMDGLVVAGDERQHASVEAGPITPLSPRERSSFRPITIPGRN